ncbi:MAG: ribbon-helix-helix protein, CopG family [Miltoncostaeaceae bacterium]
MTKRNVTVQLDEDVIRRAKVLAARRGASVSALIGIEIQRLVDEDDRYEAARERAMQALDDVVERGGRQWTRDALHER